MIKNQKKDVTSFLKVGDRNTILRIGLGKEWSGPCLLGTPGNSVQGTFRDCGGLLLLTELEPLINWLWVKSVVWTLDSPKIWWHHLQSRQST